MDKAIINKIPSVNQEVHLLSLQRNRCLILLKLNRCAYRNFVLFNNRKIRNQRA